MLANISSLNHLRTFALAAKHLSFKIAAQKLNISSTAVSHQIKALEEQLRVSLFERHIRAISLTPAGKKLAQCCQFHLAEIDYVIQHLSQDRNDVSISCCHSFAALWLTPKSNLFTTALPKYNLNIFASDTLVDIEREQQLDIAIRYGEDNGDESEQFLYRENISIYQNSQHGVNSEILLEKSNTLFVTQWPENDLLANIPWQHHLQSHHFQVKTFPQEFFVLQAVMTSQGIGLLSDVLAASAVEHGWIKKVEGVPSFKGYSYWLRENRYHSESLRVKHATQWIINEFHKLEVLN